MTRPTMLLFSAYSWCIKTITRSVMPPADRLVLALLARASFGTGRETSTVLWYRSGRRRESSSAVGRGALLVIFNSGWCPCGTHFDVTRRNGPCPTPASGGPMEENAHISFP